MLPFESIPKPQGLSGSLTMTHALNWADAGGTTARNPDQPIRQNRATMSSLPLCNAELNISPILFLGRAERSGNARCHNRIES
jgi:hypothetical protein